MTKNDKIGNRGAGRNNPGRAGARSGKKTLTQSTRVRAKARAKAKEKGKEKEKEWTTECASTAARQDIWLPIARSRRPRRCSVGHAVDGVTQRRTAQPARAKAKAKPKAKQMAKEPMKLKIKSGPR